MAPSSAAAVARRRLRRADGRRGEKARAATPKRQKLKTVEPRVSWVPLRMLTLLKSWDEGKWGEY